MTNDRLKAGRLQAGLTQKQAAEALGVSQSYLAAIKQSPEELRPYLLSSIPWHDKTLEL